jgi:hypothetical protein
MARILGLHHRNIVAIISRCQLIDTTINLKWATKSKAQQFDVLSSITKTIIEV